MSTVGQISLPIFSHILPNCQLGTNEATNLVAEAAGGMLFDTHVDKGAGGGQGGLHLGEAVLHSLKDKLLLDFEN